MSQHHEHHNHPLGPAPVATSGRVPGNHFGALVGIIDHLTLAAHDGPKPDDNHVYVWLKVASGPVAGKYECAFNTESTSGPAEAQYLVKDEAIGALDIPQIGFSNAKVSYKGLGLHQANFKPIANGALRTAIFDWARTATLVTAYGVTYPKGDGIHDIHMNSGEKPGSGHANRVNQDGALVFYYAPAGEQPHRRWVFIKFATQVL